MTSTFRFSELILCNLVSKGSVDEVESYLQHLKDSDVGFIRTAIRGSGYSVGSGLRSTQYNETISKQLYYSVFCRRVDMFKYFLSEGASLNYNSYQALDSIIATDQDDFLKIYLKYQYKMQDSNFNAHLVNKIFDKGTSEKCISMLIKNYIKHNRIQDCKMLFQNILSGFTLSSNPPTLDTFRYIARDSKSLDFMLDYLSNMDELHKPLLHSVNSLLLSIKESAQLNKDLKNIKHNNSKTIKL